MFNADGSTAISTFATGVDSPVAIELGPDGLLYHASAVSGEIRRIRYNGPTAIASSGPVDRLFAADRKFLERRLQGLSRGHSDLLPMGLRRRNDVDGCQSCSHVLDLRCHNVHGGLTVTATDGAQVSTTVRVTVGSQPPVVTITTPATGTITPGQTVIYEGSATDPDEGPLPPTALAWTIRLHHNTHVHVKGSSTGSQGTLTAENHGIGSLACTRSR